MTGSDVLHHDQVMAGEADPHAHTQDSHDKDLEQAGSRAIMEMGNTLQLLCCDQDVGLHSIGNAALCLRSWCDAMQQFRGDKERVAKAAAHAREFEAKMNSMTHQGASGLGRPVPTGLGLKVPNV